MDDEIKTVEEAEEKAEEKKEIKENTGISFADIIDKLNSNKGYNIKYILYFFPNGLVSKEHRT